MNDIIPPQSYNAILSNYEAKLKRVKKRKARIARQKFNDVANIVEQISVRVARAKIPESLLQLGFINGGIYPLDRVVFHKIRKETTPMSEVKKAYHRARRLKKKLAMQQHIDIIAQ